MSNDSAPKLLPCPFCGSSDVRWCSALLKAFRPIDASNFVRCDCCKAETAMGPADDAAWSWNRRASRSTNEEVLADEIAKLTPYGHGYTEGGSRISDRDIMDIRCAVAGMEGLISSIKKKLLTMPGESDD